MAIDNSFLDDELIPIDTNDYTQAQKEILEAYQEYIRKYKEIAVKYHLAPARIIDEEQDDGKEI